MSDKNICKACEDEISEDTNIRCKENFNFCSLQCLLLYHGSYFCYEDKINPMPEL
jgi:recombinational DNA repair protein RecR